ncbi:MAG: hypothetical protein Q7T66_01280 [Herminiimonas sp.]|uniref:hypothetical protein n=1 Tax=Herminiimonas sp. TaxID=1926289 RepID=UPI002726C354|nr:hypothetical protein [Herminiimonas sp.]MDO9419271.1 hypothetical protein [Herminiimonas sp.]
MTLANQLNIAGVVGTTVGSFLVWYFIAKAAYDNHKEFISGKEKDISFTIPTPTEDLRLKLRNEMYLSRLGIALIVIGGVLQIAAASI